jgi:hypothetical protein
MSLLVKKKRPCTVSSTRLFFFTDKLIPPCKDMSIVAVYLNPQGGSYPPTPLLLVACRLNLRGHCGLSSDVHADYICRLTDTDSQRYAYSSIRTDPSDLTVLLL